MPPPEPINITPATVAHAGAELGSVGTGLSAALTALRTAVAQVGPAAGEKSTVAAYDEMWGAWDGHITTVCAALGQLSQKLAVTAKDFQRTDDEAVPDDAAPGKRRGR